jgi:hypothetical protein
VNQVLSQFAPSSAVPRLFDTGTRAPSKRAALRRVQGTTTMAAAASPAPASSQPPPPVGARHPHGERDQQERCQQEALRPRQRGEPHDRADHGEAAGGGRARARTASSSAAVTRRAKGVSGMSTASLEKSMG